MKIQLKRRDLPARIIQTVHAGQGLGASVYLIEEKGQRWAVKDFSQTPPKFRRLVAPILVARECKALRHLDGTPGVPRWGGKIDALAFASEFVAGKPLDLYHKGEVAPEIFGRIEAAIAQIHARGVAHGDLKRRSNILISPDDEVYLLDFAAAIVARGPLSTRLMRALAQIDDKSVPRLKKHVAPELLTLEDHRKLDNPTRLEKWARRWLGR